MQTSSGERKRGSERDRPAQRAANPCPGPTCLAGGKSSNGLLFADCSMTGAFFHRDCLTVTVTQGALFPTRFFRFRVNLTGIFSSVTKRPFLTELFSSVRSLLGLFGNKIPERHVATSYQNLIRWLQVALSERSKPFLLWVCGSGSRMVSWSKKCFVQDLWF